MTLYHGSDKIIDKPAYDYKNSTNDFGAGLYCTEHIELAKEWACKKGSDGFVNIYECDITGLKILNLTDDNYNILNWLALLTRYRGYWQQKAISQTAKEYLQENFLIDISDCDVIIGYRADDSYFSFAQDFISGVISIEQLSVAMSLGNLGEQILIKSRKAFSSITYVDIEYADANIYYNRKVQRDLNARREYNNTKSNTNINDTFIIDIMRGRVDINDLRI